MNPTTVKIALALVVFLVGISLYGAVRYIQVMFNSQLGLEAVVEGFHYSVQSITTIGYGYWEPSKGTAWKLRTTDLQRELQILELKRVSLGIGFLGAFAFGALIAACSEAFRSA